MARVLLLFTHAPHDGVRAREGLDAGLAALAFEHELSVLFAGAGVALLRPGVQAATGLRAWTAGLRALPVHGADRIGADGEALAVHGIDPGAALMPVQSLSAAARRQWIADADVILPF
jgi:tRNA 2-thiouridine synthesizing protein C